MADLIRQMEEGHETADIDGVIDEVAAARGTYDTLDDRLDAMGGAPSPSSSSPEMDGTASAGESDEFARGDHVHPHDTAKQDTVLGSWTPDTSTTHQTPAGTDTVLEALQKIDRNQRADETNILSNWELGKNYLKLTRDSIKAANSSFTWNGYTATANQVTFTINEDLSITMSGTASTTFEFVLISRLSNTFYLPTGDYYLSGAIGGGDALNIAMNRTVSGSGVRYGADSGSGLDITVTDSTASTGIWIAINSGTPTNTTFKPMIISKANKDNGNTDYQPYAMSNVELTSNILSNASYSGTSSTTTFAAFLKNAANALGINGRNACEVAVYGAGSGEYLLMFFIYEADVYEYHTTLANNVISLSAANSAGTLALSGGTAPYKASVRFLA